MKKYFIITHLQFLVNGYRRCAWYDIQRGKTYFFPSFFYSFCHKINGMEYAAIQSLFNESEYIFVDEYLNFILKYEFGYIATLKDKQAFLKWNLEYDDCKIIENAIIQVSQKNEYINDAICENISSISFDNYPAFQFICYDQISSISYLKETIEYLKLHFNSSYSEIIINYFSDLSDFSKLEVLLNEYTYISRIIIHSANYNKEYRSNEGTMIFYTQQKFSNELCGTIKIRDFSLNFQHFSEAKKYNTCLNRKLCIDVNGVIKNCPAMNFSFGNIKDTKLSDVFENTEFQKYWYITKDKIDVCKDCEYRYMCIDCRCFIKDSENIYSQPSKCTYNPYITKWEGEKDYISVENCGRYTKETGFIPNRRKISKINKKIWNE